MSVTCIIDIRFIDFKSHLYIRRPLHAHLAAFDPSALRRPIRSMAAKDPSYSPVGVTAHDLQAERACFYGTLLASLAYGELLYIIYSCNAASVHLYGSDGATQGALLMIYIQLTQVLLARPKRGQSFWAIVAYSGLLFPLATLAVGAVFKFSEMSYIDNRNYPGGPNAFYREYSSDYVNVIGQVR
jgi:hypothetical protein